MPQDARYPEFITQNGETIDTNTGEALDESRYADIMDLVVPDREEPLAQLVKAAIKGDGTMPVHIQMMKEHNVPTHVVSSYIGVRPTPTSEVLNKVFEVTGAIVYFSGPYSSRKRQNPDGTPYIEDGYYKILLKTTATKDREIVGSAKKIKQNIVLSTSGKVVGQIVLAMINEHGWYDFKDGHTEFVIFSQDAPGEAQYMEVLPGKPE